MSISARVKSGTGITPYKVHQVLSGDTIRIESWDLQRVKDALDRVATVGGLEEETLRNYLLLLNKALWIKVAEKMKVKVGTVRTAVIGNSSSPQILAEIEREILLQHSAASHGEAAKQALIARPGMYRGLYTRVAAQLGVSVSFVSYVAAGKKKSPRVEQALAAEALRIENSLTPSAEASA